MRVSDDYLSCVCAVAESKAIPTNADEIALDLRDLRQAAREALNVIACCELCYMENAIDALRAQLGQGREGERRTESEDIQRLNQRAKECE